MASSSQSLLKPKVVQLYKTLIFMGREYPTDPALFRQRVHNAFNKNRLETDPNKISELIGKGEYIVKELEALYMLKKYRTLKRRYYENDEIDRRFAEFDQKFMKSSPPPN